MSNQSNPPPALPCPTVRLYCCGNASPSPRVAVNQDSPTEIVYTKAHITEFAPIAGQDVPVSRVHIDRTYLMFGVLMVIDHSQPSEARYFGIRVDPEYPNKPLKNIVGVQAHKVAICLSEGSLQYSRNMKKVVFQACNKNFTAAFCHYVYDLADLQAQRPNPRALQPVLTTDGNWYKECGKKCPGAVMRDESQFKRKPNGEWYGECRVHNG